MRTKTMFMSMALVTSMLGSMALAAQDTRATIEEYPLWIMGEQVTSENNINDLFPDFGTLKYVPSENKLIFDDFELGNTDENATATFFIYDGNLTVEGDAELVAMKGIFYCSGKLTFAEGCNITCDSRSADTTAVVNAKELEINGDLDVYSQATDPVIASKGITIDCGKLYIKGGENSTAIAAGWNSAKAVISMDNMLIEKPEGGKLSDNKQTIVDKNGNDASEIRLVHVSPTPTPEVTAAPTPRVTNNPRVSTAPQISATPTVTSKPDPKISATPTVTPVSQITISATPTVTPVPETDITSEPTKPKITMPPVEPSVAEYVTESSKKMINNFVENIYRYVLNRDPEAEGVAYWTDELYAFNVTGAEVAQGFIFSQEFYDRNVDDEEFVTILYQTFFGRHPDDDGLDYWMGKLADGTMDRTTVANGFIFSQEWADACAVYGIRSGGEIKAQKQILPNALTNRFVKRMYVTAMERDYDEEGLKYWAELLANFEVTGESVGACFFLSEEMESFDLSDEEFLERLYLTFMDRESDADGASYWLGVMADGASREDVVYGFTRSPEFTEKCVEARILPY